MTAIILTAASQKSTALTEELFELVDHAMDTFDLTTPLSFMNDEGDEGNEGNEGDEGDEPAM